MASLLQRKISLISKIVLFTFILLGLGVPLHQAQAFVGVLAMLIATTVFSIALQLVLIFSYLIMLIAHAILTWVISPAFITLPYTSGGIVDIGWPITRDLANMGFVFVLVIIGLATALRLREYEAKKTLPSLIGMILLVNFTPVIAGLVVDAANIIMVFFIESVSMAGLVAVMQNPVLGVLNSFANLVTANLTGQTTLLAKTWILIVFQLMTAMFFAIFAVLFIVRYIAIWTLVIFSPLAFFAYILPTTRRYFSAWWNQFFQWSFVGVVAAFFLYLSEQLLVAMQATPFVSPPSPPGVLQPLAEVFNTVLPYIVVEVFLVFGFLASLVSGAVGAGAVMSTGKQWSSTAAKAVGKRAGTAAKKGFAESGMGQKARAFAQRMSDLKTPGTDQKGPMGAVKRAFSAAPMRVFRKGAQQTAQFLDTGQDIAAAEKALSNVKDKEGLVAAHRNATTATGRIAALNRMIQEKVYKDVMEQGLLTIDQVEKDLRDATRLKAEGTILSANPHLKSAEEILRKRANEGVLSKAAEPFRQALENEAIQNPNVVTPQIQRQILQMVQKRQQLATELAFATGTKRTNLQNRTDALGTKINSSIASTGLPSLTGQFATYNANLQAPALVNLLPQSGFSGTLAQQAAQQNNLTEGYAGFFKKMKPEQLAMVNPDVIARNEIVQKGFSLGIDSSRAGKYVAEHGDKGLDAILDAIHRDKPVGVSDVQWLASGNTTVMPHVPQNRNPGLLRYLNNQARQQYLTLDANNNFS